MPGDGDPHLFAQHDAGDDKPACQVVDGIPMRFYERKGDLVESVL